MSLRPSHASSCAINRLSAVLAAGLRVSPATGVIHTRPPDHTCAICLDPLFGCSNTAEDDYATCGDPDQWSMRTDKNTGVALPVVTLTVCQHQFHVHCMARWMGNHSTCPVCTQPVDLRDVDDIRTSNEELERSMLPVEIPEPDGSVSVYHRQQDGQGRLMQKKLPDNSTEIYEGARGAERKVRTEFPDGIDFFEGERGRERLVRAVFRDGRVELFEGEKDRERIVEVRWPSGQKEFFEGSKGSEHLVQIDYADGSKEFLAGPQGDEYKIRSEHPDGSKRFFQGTRENEHLVEIHYPDGSKEFYEGPRYREYVVRTQDPDGRDGRGKRVRTGARTANPVGLSPAR